MIKKNDILKNKGSMLENDLRISKTVKKFNVDYIDFR